MPPGVRRRARRRCATAPDGYDRLAPGARRLGAAFQKLNFVRDLADDHDVLRRDYFPGLDVDRFCDADRDRILDDIDADLAAAARVVPAPAGQQPPGGARRPRDVRRARLPAAPDVRRGDPAHPRAGADRGEAADRRRRDARGWLVNGASVVGGGIAGLATAALLASRGHSVDLLEKNDELGGRVGSVERDGFRFDTGASWYLMPEVFEHFFSLLGTSAEAELDLTVLDPSYRVFFEGHPDPVDLRPDREHNRALFESIEPGAGDRFDAYLALGRGHLRHGAAPLPLQQLRLAHLAARPPTSYAARRPWAGC